MNRPSVFLEGLLGWLIPRACREHVLGDLSERYRSPGRYMIEALRTIPMVVLSQMRRQWDGTVVAIEACALFVAFETAWRFADLPLLTELPQFLPLVISVLAALAGFVFRDVYVDRESKPLVRPLFSAGVAIACVGAVEIFLQKNAPALALPWNVIFCGGLMAVVMLALVDGCLWMGRCSGPAVIWYMMIHERDDPESLQKDFRSRLNAKQNSLWIVFAVTASGVLTRPALDRSLLERRCLAIAAVTLVFLLTEKVMQLKAVIVRKQIEARNPSEVKQ